MIRLLNFLISFQFYFLLLVYLVLGVAKLPSSSTEGYNDLIFHAFGYFVLVLSGLLVFPNKKSIVKLLVLFFIYSFIIECIQYFIPYRSFSLFDLVANGLGLALGGFVWGFCLPLIRALLKALLGKQFLEGE